MMEALAGKLMRVVQFLSLVLFTVAGWFKMKSFDWLYGNKLSINIDREPTAFRLVK